MRANSRRQPSPYRLLLGETYPIRKWGLRCVVERESHIADIRHWVNAATRNCPETATKLPAGGHGKGLLVDRLEVEGDVSTMAEAWPWRAFGLVDPVRVLMGYWSHESVLVRRSSSSRCSPLQGTTGRGRHDVEGSESGPGWTGLCPRVTRQKGSWSSFRPSRR